MGECGMTTEEARELLIKAGVAEERISGLGLMFTAVLCDLLMKRFAELLAERVVAEFLDSKSSEQWSETIH